MPIAWYRTQLRLRPIMTQAVTTGCLFGAGDVIAQQIIADKKFSTHDWMRTLRNASYGFFLFGPAVTTWYRALDKIHVTNFPKLNVPARVLADQLIFTPLHLTAFFTYHAVLEGDDVNKKLNEAFWPTIRKNWMIWPAVQMVNFAFIPLEFRTLFVNVIALAWNTYLSYANDMAKTGNGLTRRR